MVAPATRAPELPRPVFSRQHWGDVVFVHWKVPTSSVVSFFPPGTRPDEVEPGMTYVGLVPFKMSDVSFVAPWAVPYFGRFLETNVRLYSVDAAGRQGVLFCSMDAQRLAVVGLARAVFGFPYLWSRMSAERRGDRLRYVTSRRGAGDREASRVEIEIGAPVAATELDSWLTARWGAHTRQHGCTWWVPNSHEAWPLHEVRAVSASALRVSPYGVEPGREPDLVRFSPGVLARFGRPERVA